MRFLIVIILLAFPVAEIWLLVELANRYGWWLLFYLVAVGWLGLQLIRQEKLIMSGRFMETLSAGGNPMRVILGSARHFFAGVFLIIPGVMTDIIAVALLLIPVENSKLNTKENVSHSDDQKTNFNTANNNIFNKSYKDKSKTANDEVIEGEFTKIKDE